MNDAAQAFEKEQHAPPAMKDISVERLPNMVMLIEAD